MLTSADHLRKGKPRPTTSRFRIAFNWKSISFGLGLLLGSEPVWPQTIVNFPVPSDAGFSGYAVLNPGSTAAPVTLTAYADTLDGRTLTAVTLTVPAEGQIARLAAELFPGITSGTGGLRGWVQATSAATGLLGIESSGDFETSVQAINGATPSAEQVLPVPGRTRVLVVNPGLTALSVTIRAYDATGTLVGSAISKTLQAKGMYDSEFQEGILFGTDLVATFASARHVRVSATGPVAATALFYSTLVRDGADSAAVNGTDPDSAPMELNFPHVVSGPLGDLNYATQISVTNPGSTPQRLTLTLTPDSGLQQTIQVTVPSNGTLQKTIPEIFSLPAGYLAGWLSVRGISALAGYAVFAETTGGGIDVVPVQPAGQMMQVFAHIADLQPWMTGLALLNSSATDAIVDVFAMQPDGALIGGAQTLSTARFTLPAKTRRARLLSELIPGTQSRSSDGGFVYVRSANNVPLFGMELFFLRNGAAMANVSAEAVPMGITYTAPYPTVAGVNVSPPVRLWSGPVMSCLEATIGRQAAQDLQYLRRPPTDAETQAMKDCNAPSPVYEKLDLSSLQPADKAVSVTVGPVEIAYHNPVTLGLLENGVNTTFVARNTGPTKVTLRAMQTTAMLQSKPSWMLDWYPIFGFPHASVDARQADVLLEPGASATFEWYTSNDSATGQALYTLKDGYLLPNRTQGSLPYRFDVVETGASTSISVDILAYDRSMIATLQHLNASVLQPAAITGKLTNRDGQPIASADIQIWLLSNANVISLRTDNQGRFSTQLPSIEDVKRLMSPYLEPYGKIGYSLWVAAPGYSLGWRGGIVPRSGQTVVVDLTLDPVGSVLSYQQLGEARTDGYYGYWWTMFTPGLDAVVAVQADHGVQPAVPGHAIKVDLSGREVWRVPTANQCWGLDVSPNGEWTATVCYDNLLYLIDRQGNPVHKLAASANQVRFSPDGKSIVAANARANLSLFDVATGNNVWTYTGHDGNLYNVRWSADGTRITAGFGGGQVTQLTADGRPLWQTAMGQYPLYLAVDTQYRVYAAGKANLIYSWDGSGRQRWRERTFTTVNNGLGGVTRDGSYLVTHTYNGELAAYDGAGHILWQRGSPKQGVSGSSGHQGLKITPDGAWTVYGIMDGTVVLMDKTGTVRWTYTSPDPPVTRQGGFCYQPTCTGAQSVDISDDGKFIAVGFENSVIRIFQRDP
jgi:hypothetical protein